MHFVGVEVQYKCIKESLHGGWASYLVSSCLQAVLVQHYLGGPSIIFSVYPDSRILQLGSLVVP